MFGDVNEVKLMGNVTSDVECKFTPSGTPVLNFSIATNRSYKQNDQWVEEVTYHSIVLWRNADKIAERIKKGTRLYLEGRLTVRSWEANGERKYRTEIMADRVILIDRYNKPEAGNTKPTDNPEPEFSNTQMVEDGAI